MKRAVERLSSDNQDEWVSPFGNPGVKGCSHLTPAYRSVPRPSSPVCAKASTNCPYLTLESPHHQHQRRNSARVALTRARRRPAARQACRRAAQLGCGMIISARCLNENIERRSSRRSLAATAPTPSPTPRGIDLKNPFTMSKRIAEATRNRCVAASEPMSSSIWCTWEKWWSLSGSNR